MKNIRFFYKYEWYRRWVGGKWYLNRHWFDLGRGVIWWWGKKGETPGRGGPLCTMFTEEYVKITKYGR